MAVLLLTGSTGFIGSWILQMLEDTVKAYKSKRYKIEIVEGNLLDHRSLSKAAEGVDAVIHTAALYDASSSKKSFLLSNVEGTKALIDSLKPVTRFVLTSTYGVYGFPNEKEPIDEDFEPKRPIWHYQKSKKVQEDMARKLCRERNIRFCAVRPPTTIGPRERLFIPGMITFIQEGKLMLIDGGDNIIPFAHGEDAARAHLLALKQIDENDGEAFHFESFHVPFKEMVAAFCRELGLQPVTKSVPLFMASTVAVLSDAMRKIGFDPPFTRFMVRFLSSHSLLDQNKIKNRLGYEPQYDLEQTVSESVKWYNETKPISR
jgi:dihydroflavonol-4-reductase